MKAQPALIIDLLRRPHYRREQLLIRLAYRRKHLCRVGANLLIELTHLPIRRPHQHCKNPPLRLAYRHKHPCRIGKILFIDFAHSLLRRPHQCGKQIPIILGYHRKYSCCVGQLLIIRLSYRRKHLCYAVLARTYSLNPLTYRSAALTNAADSISSD